MITENAKAIGAEMLEDKTPGIEVYAGKRTAGGIVIPSAGDPTPSMAERKAARDKKSKPATEPAAEEDAQVVEVETPAVKVQPKAKPAPPKTLTLNFPVVGGIPSQYKHIYYGDRVLVLGIIEGLSFVPQPEKVGNPVRFGVEGFDGKQFAHMGLSFIDDTGTNNIILLEVK